jgi:hypothetical protein
MDPTTSSIYATPPRPSSSMSQVSLPSMEKGTVKMPSNFVTYVIVKLSTLDEIVVDSAVERMKSIVYIGETSQAPQ